MTLGGLTVTGWHTIAESSLAIFRGIQSEFSIDFYGSSRRETLKVSVLAHADTAAKTHSNTTIRILDQAGVIFTSIGSRLVKSDSVSDAGFKVQVYLNIVAASALNIQIIKNLQNGNTGFSLVTPYLDNTPLLPDGVTVGTFLEAGEELSFGTGSAHMWSNFVGTRVSNDTLRCMVQWPEIPKQGTGLTITLPGTSLLFRDGSGFSTGAVTGAYTISNFTIVGKSIMFYINETGLFTGLNIGAAFPIWTGGSGKLTIT